MAMRARAVEIDRQHYTSEEFEQMPEFDENFELIDGRLVEKEMPGYRHGRIAGIIRDHYRDFDRAELIGAMGQEISVRLGPKNTLTPDVAFWNVAHKPSEDSEGAAPMPDLAIEVLSHRDLKSKKHFEEVMVKVHKFRMAGVPMIWLVNPRSKTVTIYKPEQAEPMQILGSADELDGADVIPGFKLKVSDLFN